MVNSTLLILSAGAIIRANMYKGSFAPLLCFISQGHCNGSGAVRVITTNNETHSCVMNDWSVIRQKLISAMDPPDATRAKEMKQSDIKSTWHLPLFRWTLTNGSLWLLMFDTFSLWAGFRMAAFRLSGPRDGWSQRGPDGLWLDSDVSRGSRDPRSQKWKHIERVAPRLPRISCSISRPFLCRLSKYSVRMMLLFPPFCSQRVNAQQPRSLSADLTGAVVVRCSSFAF